jgi:peptidoglycan/LPS O-acetylase OafA/YrhL
MSAKILYLEGLRGIAAFTVFLGHFVLVSWFFFGSIPYLNLLVPWGQFSVCIFFVLSGYVLTHSFFLQGNQEILTSGAVRRYLRLLIPILFVCLIIFAWYYPIFGGINNLGSILHLYSVMFWGIFFQGQTISYLYAGVLWTITIEFIGSFIVFSFASLFGKLRNRWIFYCIAIILFFNSYYLAFILGMALADSNNCRFSNIFRIKNSYAFFLIFIALFFRSIFTGYCFTDFQQRKSHLFNIRLWRRNS